MHSLFVGSLHWSKLNYKNKKRERERDMNIWNFEKLKKSLKISFCTWLFEMLIALVKQKINIFFLFWKFWN